MQTKSLVWVFALVVLVGTESLQARTVESERTTEVTAPLASALGVRFVEGSTSLVIVERNGQEYVVDLVAKTIRENKDTAENDASPARVQQAASPSSPADDKNLGVRVFQQQCAMCHGVDGKGLRSAGTPDLTDKQVQTALTDEMILNTIRNGKPGTAMQPWAGKLSDAEIRSVAATVRTLGSGQELPRAKFYIPADDFVYTLPTGRSLARHGFYVNFTHRFPYNPSFSGRGLGDMLLSLDGFSIPSFGFKFGITDRLSVSAYRSPSAISRPIEFMLAYNLLDEQREQPLNVSVRVSEDGQDNFSQNFTTNFEMILSKSVSRNVQFYGVPTVSLGSRRLISKPGPLEDPPPNLPGFNSFSLGVGGAFNIRPTVALVADVIPTLVNGRELGIHRPAYGFGIQKRVRGHAFTLGFSNNPGTIVSQRAGTRATFVGDPSADKPGGLFIGFDLMRQLH